MCTKILVGKGPVVGSCDHSNETSGSIKGGECVVMLSCLF
jgi:hypothetical protein